MQRSIVLIGPVGAGKSTQGSLLAEALGWPQCRMDQVRKTYYAEIGYDDQTAKDIFAQEGFAGMYRHWKPFEIYAVERVLADYQDKDTVIDFGGGHSVYEDDALFARAKTAFAPYANVVLLLPCPDLDESVRLLRERSGGFVSHDIDFDEHFTKHHSNHDLAKIVVYTQDRTPEQTRDDILARIQL